jgi:hypothetical protein
VILADKAGRESLLGETGKLLLLSTDSGDTWSVVGTGGAPTVIPGADGALNLVVAAKNGPVDYWLHNSTPDEVTGSDGRLRDGYFAVSPTFPDGGSFSPALLLGIDRATHFPYVLRCSSSFACTGATPVNAPEDGAAANFPAGDNIETVLYLAGDYTRHGTVFVNTPRGVFKSLDGGRSFTELQVIPDRVPGGIGTPMMALAPGYRETGPIRTAYVAAFQQLNPNTAQMRTIGGIYRTDDGGTTWSAVATSGSFAGGAQAVAVAPDGRLFAGYINDGGVGGLLCSADHGRTWRPSCPAVGDGRPLPASPTVLATPHRADGGTSIWIYGSLAAGILAFLLGGAATRRRLSRRP